MLIVENGSVVANANSYISVDDARAYAEMRGLTLPDDDYALEQRLTVALDYIEAQRSNFKGSKVSSAQALQWPRKDVCVDAFPFPADAIPAELKAAQVRLASLSASGVDLMPTGEGLTIKRDVTGPLETEYFSGSGGLMPRITSVDALLAPLLRNAGALRSVRV